MKNDPIKWTDEMDAVLREFDEKGRGGSSIRDELQRRFRVTVTRNMIAGRRRRLRLARMRGPRGPLLAPRKRKATATMVESPSPEHHGSVEEVPIAPLPEPHRGGNKTLLELGSGDCRWPIGDPRDPSFVFCGELRDPGSSYCPEHKDIAWSARRAV